MTTSQRPLHDLSRRDCLELLQYHSFVGRLGFVLDGRPMVLPVNYLADADAVVFCTSEGTALGAVGDGHQVVFEVDESHPWSAPAGAWWSAGRRAWSPTPVRSRRSGAVRCTPG